MKKVIITREERLDKSIENKAKEKGIELIYCPLIKTQPVDFKVPEIKNYDYLIITSKNAVKYFLKKIPVENIVDKKVIAVGEKTKAYLKKLGFKEIILPETSSAEAIEELLKSGEFNNKKFLFLRAEKGQSIKNKNVNLLVVYKTVFNKPQNFENCKKLLEEDKIQYIIFSSPSTFYSFKENFKNYRQILNNIKIIAIGKTTKKAIENEGFNVFITPQKPSFDEIISQL
jgi:uroporphyrinogen-III synthase